MSERFNTEVLIVGTGISGLLAAIKLSERYSVTILSKSSLNDCSTAWAQGGIAAVIDNKDSINNHIKDTLDNGHEMCNLKSVQQVVQQGKVFGRPELQEITQMKEKRHATKRTL